MQQRSAVGGLRNFSLLPALSAYNFLFHPPT